MVNTTQPPQPDRQRQHKELAVAVPKLQYATQAATAQRNLSYRS